MNAPTVPEETTWWSKFFIFSAILSLVILVSGPFGYKYGVTDLGPSLISILVALVAAILVFVVGAIMAVVATKKSLVKDRNLIFIAMAISLVPMLFVVPQMLKAQSVPAIHDISTDTVNPPAFDSLVERRKDTDNDLEYIDDAVGAETASIQKKAYPSVTTLVTDMSAAAALEKSAQLLAAQGLEVVGTNESLGIVEATATTLWFGFKDDVVVRVQANNGQTRVDVRSVSRVGRSDVGANAARIEKFLAAFKQS